MSLEGLLLTSPLLHKLAENDIVHYLEFAYIRIKTIRGEMKPRSFLLPSTSQQRL